MSTSDATVYTLFPPPDPDDNPLVCGVAELVAHFGYGAVLAELEMHQPPRAVASAPARSTDPETSHGAAKREPDVGRFSFKSRQARLLQAFAARGPFTDQQATIHVVGSAAPPSAWDGCRRRCSDLRAAGYLSDTGKRRCNVGSNDAAIVWQVTIAGLSALESLEESGWSK
jgi:hypothetical protein